MSELDTFFFFNDIREYIEQHGAETFLKEFNRMFPHHAHALTSSVLEDHSHDYDKKKAALLKAHASKM